MEKVFIIGNWKSNKTIPQTKEWFAGISNFQFPISNKQIIVCPPFTLVPLLKSLIIKHKSNLKLGAQDISPFDEGPYTGEVSARQIKEFADYVIIGHSERRKHFGETAEMIGQKTKQAAQHSLTSILCVSYITQLKTMNHEPITKNVIIAYEPLSAIGSGNPDTPENADKMAEKIKEKLGDLPILYGGSVTAANVHTFTSMPNVGGVLVGGASLDPNEFSNIIQHA